MCKQLIFREMILPIITYSLEKIVDLKRDRIVIQEIHLDEPITYKNWMEEALANIAQWLKPQTVHQRVAALLSLLRSGACGRQPIDMDTHRCFFLLSTLHSLWKSKENYLWVKIFKKWMEEFKKCSRMMRRNISTIFQRSEVLFKYDFQYKWWCTSHFILYIQLGLALVLFSSFSTCHFTTMFITSRFNNIKIWLDLNLSFFYLFSVKIQENPVLFISKTLPCYFLYQTWRSNLNTLSLGSLTLFLL